MRSEPKFNLAGRRKDRSIATPRQEFWWICTTNFPRAYIPSARDHELVRVDISCIETIQSNYRDSQGSPATLLGFQGSCDTLVWYRFASEAKYGVPKVGDDFFDVDLVTLDGKATKKLSEFMKPGRHLVLSFGSCT